LQYDMSLGAAWGHHLRTVGRLQPGIRLEQATREIDALAHGVLQERRPATYDPNVKFVIASLQEEVTRSIKPALVAVGVAVALVLLVSAGLLWRGLNHLFAINPGFNASGLLTMQVQTSDRRFNKETNDQFFAQALESVRHVPGITSAAFTSQLPLSGDDDEYGVSESNDPKATYNVFRYG